MLRGESGTTRPLDRATIFEVGSVTKTFTALLLAEMVRRGEVRLEEPIDELLPPNVIAPAHDGKRITLLDLATQSSGLPRLPDNLAPRDPRNPYAGYDDARLFEFLSHYRMTRDPGAQYEYSNLGVGLLGRLLALRAKTGYEALVRARILEPLKMESTAVTLGPALRARLATGHDVDAESVENWDLDALAGAAGLRSDVRDMSLYLRAVMSGTGRLGEDARAAEEPRRDGPPGNRIGLAWNTTAHGVVWHNGETGGYHAFIGFDEGRNRGIVVLANTALSFDDIAMRWLDSTEALAKTYRTIPLDRDALGPFVGTYKLAGQSLVVTREGDRLYAKYDQQPRFRIYPYAPAKFFYKVVDAQIDFTVENGRATSLVLHQGGRDFTAERIDG